jgi:catechol 2,3-dioxygenase-like lactoylglutathione lyase family enzyme
MSSVQVSPDGAVGEAQHETLTMALEVVVIPVSDVDRALAFYDGRLGWRLDADVTTGPDFRVVQLTPPGSRCRPRPTSTAGRPLSSLIARRRMTVRPREREDLPDAVVPRLRQRRRAGPPTDPGRRSGRPDRRVPERPATRRRSRPGDHLARRGGHPRPAGRGGPRPPEDQAVRAAERRVADRAPRPHRDRRLHGVRWPGSAGAAGPPDPGRTGGGVAGRRGRRSR